MNSSSASFALLATVLFLSPLRVEGQGPPADLNVVERVVAVVGDSVVLMTELEEFLISMEARGWARPTGTAELHEARLDVLEQLINQQLILQEAAKDTLLEVSEEELEDRVRQEIEGQVRQFGTLGLLQQALAEQNMTMAVFREQRKNLIRRQLMQDRYFAKRGQSVNTVVVTEEEARTYFDENQDAIPERPAAYHFESAQLLPEPTEAADAEVLAEADSVLALLFDGGDFAELAARFSDGPTGSAGGELGWIREDGGYVEEFEEMAFQLPAGGLSPPVKTQFGYHIIMVERVRGGERRVRHILFEPEITAGDIERNDARAESFAARLEAGETMADLGLEPDTAEVSLDVIAQSSPALAGGIQAAEEGEVVGPVRIDDPRSPNGWHLARLLQITPGGTAEYADFRDVIMERLKSEGLNASVVEGLRSRAYIEVRLGGG